MTAAIALAVVLVIAVAGASMALESQRSGSQTAARRPPRPRPASPGPGPSRRPRVRDRMARANPTPPPAGVEPEPAAPTGDPGTKGPELLRTGVPAEAKVTSVIDERTIGPVTRSRLTVQVEPESGSAFEVTLRVAFQTPEARARVKVGGTVPVRYDRDDHTRVVVDLPQD